ncbi:MAG: rRNA (Adenine-N(6)-)-methyltransferase [Candidatus Amesbacteria bacterium GW2011_GWA2_42_12]|uniref:rRNA (Adenine-N(6)-)-methyltransferase n=1 Tax=Candidatus Amesbacteria bacterium GW2011_GWA2_42_12 TaxID=1618356 RepID=A0A0G0Y5M1_9BACT|nr:MAG: rRNA (Adenine-N(6)-)-methyltransferase [Candidatus Amesbacteria bacterium GW2011_GWA2_42_12]
MYWLRRRLYSQNFLSNRELIQKLIRESSISPQDTVLDIGSGHGTITKELLKITPHVNAIEKDPRFTSHPQDFLTYPLPKYPYKVFSNIPFGITGDIIRKLLQSPNPPSDCNLIVQSEAAAKFIVTPKCNTLAALLYYPWWDIQITHKFSRFDFRPIPKVDSVLLCIKPRPKPLVPVLQKAAYYDFVIYNFVHDPHAKFVPPSQYIKFKNNPKYKGAYSKLLQEQSLLQKIHRTRTDKNWRKF